MNKIKYQSAIECVRPTGLATMPGIEMSHFMMGITKPTEAPLFITEGRVNQPAKIDKIGLLIKKVWELNLT